MLTELGKFLDLAVLIMVELLRLALILNMAVLGELLELAIAVGGFIRKGLMLLLLVLFLLTEYLLVRAAALSV